MEVLTKLYSRSKICKIINRTTVIKYTTASSSDEQHVFDGEESHKMAAWQIHSYGGLEELQLSRSTRIPTIMNPNDVLVKVGASSVNPIDLAMMGKLSCFYWPNFVFRLHRFQSNISKNALQSIIPLAYDLYAIDNFVE